MAEKAVTLSPAAQERKWQIERAADTLMEAEEIKANKKLFAAAKKELAERQKAIARVSCNLGRAVMKKR